MQKRVQLEITAIFYGLINIIHSLSFSSLELPPLIVSNVVFGGISLGVFVLMTLINWGPKHKRTFLYL